MTALSKTGARRLADAEEKIERGLSTFMEVGAALASIRDERLYRADHDTFEDYCKVRWGFTDRRARQLIDAAQIGTVVPVTNEAQGRSLAGLSAEEAQDVYEAAEADGNTTAAGLREARSRKYPTETEVDDATTGKGSPSGAPGTPETSTGEVEDETEVDAPGARESEASASGAQPPAPLPPAQGGTEGYRAACTKARSTVRSHLLTLDPEKVIATADEPDHWRQFSTDVRGWLDELDEHLSGPALKAVQ